MAEIFDFSKYVPWPDIYGMSREELKGCLDGVRADIDALDEREPEDMFSEEYESWADAHEQLEDLADEICDLLDGM